MLPSVDEAERERHERRLARDRRRREQGKPAYFDPSAGEARGAGGALDGDPADRRTDAGLLAALEAEALDSEGLATQQARSRAARPRAGNRGVGSVASRARA